MSQTSSAVPAPTAAQPAGTAVAAPTARPVPAGRAPAMGPAVALRPQANGLVRTAMEGTPGRMRLLGFVAALAAAVFGVVGATSLWSSAGALERADHNTAQVVRVQGIYADLLRADADATSAFLVGGLENSAQRTDYDTSIAHVATEIAAAAQAQPADGEALGVLNAKVQTYAATVEQARVYNRQGLPVGAQYLSNSSASLRSSTLPIVQALIEANTSRADTEFDASSNLVPILLVGITVLLVLVLVMAWLARRTHRYLNASISLGTLLVVAALLLAAVTIGGVGNQVKVVRNADFSHTVALATARSAAFDAKSNESLTLIARGSGAAYEQAWKTQSDKVLTQIDGSGPQSSALRTAWQAYVSAHEAIRALDNGGKWDEAVAAAGKTDPSSANALFTAFDGQASKNLGSYRTDTQTALLGPVGWVTFLGWLLVVLCALAALLCIRGMGQRVEEYR